MHMIDFDCGKHGGSNEPGYINMPPTLTDVPINPCFEIELLTDQISRCCLMPVSQPNNPLDLILDAMEDPDYDPNSSEEYKGLWRWPDGSICRLFQRANFSALGE